MASEGDGFGPLARAIVRGALHVRKGENVVVETWSHSLPYALACVVEARRAGANPLLFLEDEGAFWTCVEEASPIGRWGRPGAHAWAALSKADAVVYFPGPADRTRYHALPEAVRAELDAHGPDWHRRARVARLRGVRCALGYASDAQASSWGVSPSEWRRHLTRATVEADLPAIARSARSVAAKLRHGRGVRITAPNGTDLSLRLRGRSPVIDDGSIGSDDLAHGHNLTVSPPGTVVVAVDEKSAAGIAIANRPSFLSQGRVEGGEWEMAGGRLVEARYTSGQAEFDAAFRAAPKGREIVSILSVGLNPRLGPGVAQVEDQEAGAVTIGIGGNAGYGGSNRCPFVSWIVVGEATVAVDGKPLCDRGQLF